MVKRWSKLDMIAKVSTIVGMGLISLVILNFSIVKPIVDNYKMKKREEAREVMKQRLVIEEEFTREKLKGDSAKLEELKEKLMEIVVKETRLLRQSE